jgi:hypothetical protein
MRSHILRETINVHYDRLTGTDAETMDHQVLLIRDWVKAQPALRAALAEAERAEPELDYGAWRENLDGPAGPAAPRQARHGWSGG